MALPAAAVPVRVTVLSFVTLSPTVPLSSENEMIVGASGRGSFVSIVKTSVDDAGLMPPAVVAVAARGCLPSDNAAVV